MDSEEKRKIFLNKVAELLNEHEGSTIDMNLTGCIINFNEEWYEYNGQNFEKWDGWEVQKVKTEHARNIDVCCKCLSWSINEEGEGICNKGSHPELAWSEAAPCDDFERKS
jgi:hypothetical protein